MKRKISLLVCVLALVFAFTGCGNKDVIEYDPATVEQGCEQVFAIIASGSISDEQVSSMSDWNQGYLMAQFESQTGVKMDAEDFITAIQGWNASADECGQYVSHGDYAFKSTSSTLTVTAPAEFTDRKADLEFTFDENLKLESFTVNASFSTGEILKKAGLNTLLGMGTVFCVLIFMSFIISLFKYVPALVDKSSKKQAEEPKKAAPAPAPAVTVSPEMDDTELAAVIAAAIAAYEGTSTDGFVVRSIKRRKSNKWNA